MKSTLQKLFSLLPVFYKPMVATAKNDWSSGSNSFVRDGKSSSRVAVLSAQLYVIFGFIQKNDASIYRSQQTSQRNRFRANALGVLFLLLFGMNAGAQSVYKEDFGSNGSVALPYSFGTNATGSASKNANLTTPSWNQSLASANFGGSSGGCMSGSGASNTISCTFTVASGFKLTPTSITYNYRISGTGPTALNITISGTGGSTNIAQVSTNRSGSFVGVATSNFASTTQNLTGSVTLTFSFTGGAGGGTMRLDDVTLNGTVVATTPIITGTATANAFTTTYGTASTVQNFTVSGSALTANLVATAPAGFEVSSNGTAYGSTATFTQSGGTASGTLRIRLAANAAVTGTYNSKTITLTSGSATPVNITTSASGNSVAAKGLTITGVSGVSRLYDATTVAALSGGSYSGLVNSETLPLAGTPIANFANKLVGINKPITITGYVAPSTNYTLTAQPSTTASITAAALTIPDAVVVTKIYDGSTAASITGTLTGVLGDDSVTFSSGSSFFADANPGSGIAVTAQCILLGEDADNYILTQPLGLTGNIDTVSTPTISVNPASTGTFTTTYGTFSNAQSFTVTGLVLTNDITATAGTGFEVSLDDTVYSSAVTFAQSGGNAGGSLYVRLMPTAATGTYDNVSAVILTSVGASDFNLTTPSTGNNVSAKALTITGLSGVDKIYDGTTAADFTGTPVYSGLENGETFSVSGSGTATFGLKTVGIAKTVTISGFTAPSSNYTVTAPSVTADITALGLTVTGASVTTKPYDGNTNAVITGASLIGVISGDTVTVGNEGTFASANVGNNIEVTAALTLNGQDAVNYTLTQPTLAGDIIKASQTISGLAATSSKSNTDNPYNLTAVASSGLPVSYTSSNPAVATISGSTVTIVGIAGTTTITASQPGDDNYNAASNVTQTLTVSVGPTTLAAGDIALVAINASTTDSFSVVLLKGINANTVINFTDNGFTGTNTTGRTGEGFLTFTSPTALPFGTILTWTNGVTNTGWSSNAPTNFSFNASGDQLFIFQGNTGNWSSQSGITLLFGLNYGTALNSTSTASNTLQPSSAILPSTAFLNLPASPNVYYSGTGTSATAVDLCGSAPVILANLVTAAKWLGSGSANTFPTYTVSFSCSKITTTGTVTAFSTTYGTASAAKSFAISATGLTADLIATAPTGFEVSTDGITYDTTATFVQSSGNAGGSLRIRLSATAQVAGSYNTKNIVLSSTGATSVNITTTSSGNIVSAKELTIVGINGVNKIYDGTSSASIEGTPDYSGLVNDETFSVSGIASYSFADKNVQSAKPILVTGYTAPSTNYTVSQPSITADITPKELTVSNITADNKTYDGTVNATLSATLEGIIAPDNVILSATGEFENSFQTIFFGIPANIVNLSFFLNGSDTNNYSLIQPAVEGLTADIYPKELTISNVMAFDKVYDSTTDAVVSGTLEGVIPGDVVTLISSGTFASSTIGSNIAVIPTWGIDGDTFNYTLTEPTVSLTANITSPGAPLITSAATASATYGDLTTSYFTTTNVAVDSYDATGLPAGLTIDTLTGEITGSPTQAGVFTVTLSATNSGGTGFATLTYTISTISLTITDAFVNDKSYDGNTDATISGTLTGFIPGDDISFDGTGTFDTASVGTNILVTSNIVLTGTKASNYSLTQPSGLFADITAKLLTLTASINDKVYAGSLATAAVIAVETVDGIIGSDVVNVIASGAFDTGFAGNGKNVTVTYTLAGADASNYSILSPVSLTGNITQKPLTYIAAAENKVFDGNANAIVTASNINGIIAPDTVTITGTGTFASSAIGNNIPVNNVNMILGGAQAANYSITQPGDLSADIISGPTVLAAGDIAIIGYNTSGSPDNFAILVLKDLTAGTQFFVNDNELATAASTSFTDLNEYEASFTVKSGQTIPAGTVIVLPWGAAAVSTATYDWSSTTGAGLGNNNEELYIYTASSITSSTPTSFIYFAKIGSSPSAIPAALETSTTGSGTTAITPNGSALRYSTTGNTYNSCKQTLLNEIGKITNWNTTGAASLAATDWSFTVLPACSSLVNLKMFIQGYYTGSGSMASVKNNQDGISSGIEVEDLTVELHDAVTYALVASTTATLQTDGTMTCNYNTAPNGSFYIAVKGKNVVQTWSATPQAVGSTPLNYDFSIDLSQAYTDGSQNSMIEIEPGVWAFYSGDVNQDGGVDLFDTSDIVNDNDAFEFGIKTTDLNGDGGVDLFDTTIGINNSDNFIYSQHP